MKFQVAEGEKYQKIMQIEIPFEEMELPIKLACKRLSEKVNIPGFRKGKVPRTVLESFVGMESIMQEALDEMLPNAYVEGLKETGIEPCAQPEIVVEQLAANQPVKVNAIITVKPEVKLGQYKELAVTRSILEVADEDIDHEVEMQRQRMAKQADAEADYAAQEGDTVVIDFKGMKDGVPFDGGTAEDYPLELGSHSFIPGFEEQLVGMKTGDFKAIDLTFPEQYHEPTLAGQPVVFEVTIKKITVKTLPELDQAFVEEVSETAENMEQYREEIKARLMEQSQELANDSAKDSAVKQAIDNAEIDLPPVMIEQELDHIINDMAQRMQMQGLSLEQYLQYTAGTMEDLRKNYRDRAELMVRRELVCEAIVKAENIEVSDEEVNASLQEMADAYGMPLDTIRQAIEGQGRLEDYKYGIKMQKSVDFIYESAVITDEMIDREQLKEKAAARAAVNEMAKKMAEQEQAEAAEEAGEVVEAEVKDAE